MGADGKTRIGAAEPYIHLPAKHRPYLIVHDLGELLSLYKGH